jgi:hypothetical protein
MVRKKHVSKKSAAAPNTELDALAFINWKKKTSKGTAL